MSSLLLKVENEKHTEVIYNAIREIFEVRVEEFQRLGSGWLLNRISSFSMLIAKLGKLIGGGDIELPLVLKEKNQSLLNVPGQDGKCFARAIIAHFLIEQREIQVPKPPAINTRLNRGLIYEPYLQDGAVQADRKTIVNWNAGLPFDLRNISKFENDNPTIGVHYFVCDPDEENILCVNPRKEANEVSSQGESTPNGDANVEDSPQQSSNVDSSEEESIINGVESNTLQETSQESNQDLSVDEPMPSVNVGASTTDPLGVARARNALMGGTESKKEMKRHIEIMKHAYPYHICKEVRPIQINLLLVIDGDQKHFCLIKDLKAFLKRPNNHVKAICPYCLHSIYSRDHKDHIRNCSLVGVRKVRMPSAKEKLQFKSFMSTQKMPFVLFADIESALIPIHRTTGNTIMTQKHKACAYCWACIDKDGSIVEMKSYAAVDDSEKVAEQMMTEMLACTDRCISKIKESEKEANRVRDAALRNVPLPGPYDPMPNCGFCHNHIPRGEAVRHHEHTAPYAFKFLACTSCNMHAKVDQSVNCFMHNLKGYDAHYLLRVAQNTDIVQEMTVIPVSSEKFISIKVNDTLTFMDSLNFFSASLDSVASTMDESDFHITRKYFEQKFNAIENIHENVKKLLSKGIYPYSHNTGTSSLDETCLPPKEAFFNDLTDEPISDEDYAHAQNVWDTFEIENMREYTLQYVERDVLILADCFVKMRELFIDKFDIDCVHYYTLPQLSFDLALKFTKCKLAYITDVAMHTWLELMKRGGMA
ncbi:unnamed protein product [Orchesella dallaii]|uniref:DNA-directed DNA polymerase n=1 Tax=Orchesella dallaii TaxID=48710 RepID=A0ABP1RB79_9HEXA